MAAITGARVGPIRLAPEVTKFNFWSFLYASFIVIGILAAMNILQPYVLTEILQIPRDQQGTISGNLGTWQEILAIILINPFGWLSDRIGRRPLMVFGISVAGFGFVMYPLASSVAELTVYRALFSVGASCLAAIIAVVGNDYPHESSRGKLIGFSNVMNGFGVIFISLVIARIPSFLSTSGVDPVTGGRVMYFTLAALCILSAVWFRFGLKRGIPVGSSADAPEWRVLMMSGFRAARNPRILLSYGAAFVGRADVSIKGMFVSLWAINAAPAADLTTPQAMGKVGQLIGIMSITGMFWVVFYGWILDRVNRVSGLALAMFLGGVGYTSMWLVESPLDFAYIPAFIVLSIGQMSVIAASITLVGQEADPTERGAVIAMNGFWGAVGIMLAFFVGGRLFDAYGPSAPFVMVGLVQVVLFFGALAIRIRSPGLEKPNAYNASG